MNRTHDLPAEPLERRRFQNRIAQRKFRSQLSFILVKTDYLMPNRRLVRRHQHRIDQAALKERHRTTPGHLPLCHPLGPNVHIWDERSQAPDGSTVPGQINTMFSQSLSSPQQAYMYDMAGGVVISDTAADTSHAVSLNDLPSDLDPSVPSYLSDLSGPSLIQGHNDGISFTMVPFHASTFVHNISAPPTTTVNTTVVSDGSANGSRNSVELRSSFRSARFTMPEQGRDIQPESSNQTSFPHSTDNEQLDTCPREGSLSRASDRASTSARSRGSHNHDNNNESSSRGSSRSSSSNDNPQDYLPILHIALQRGHDSIVQILLDRNMDIDERDSNGRTALQLAAMHGHSKTIQLLLQRGARVDAPDAMGRTALHWATLQKHEEVLRIFLDTGVEDIDRRDVNGWTALHVAVERGFEVGLRLLLESDADLRLRPKRCEGWKREEPVA